MNRWRCVICGKGPMGYGGVALHKVDTGHDPYAPMITSDPWSLGIADLITKEEPIEPLPPKKIKWCEFLGGA